MYNSYLYIKYLTIYDYGAFSYSMAHVICFAGCGLFLPTNDTVLHIQTDRQATALLVYMAGLHQYSLAWFSMKKIPGEREAVS